ncbi:MAG: hypothetical protein DRO99_00460 [Candidatus Aenigmatarchaeota archaeon]|nr:MAG: hypothetical protein DRO99_00460 [Candidatus Aenigmarchaeota archaeon]
MATKYVTDDGRELFVDDDGMLVSKYGNAVNGQKWKLAGYVTPQTIERDEVGKFWLDDFKPGCKLLFFDPDQEGIMYEMDGTGKARINEDMLDLGSMPFYHSRPIKEMIEDVGPPEHAAKPGNKYPLKETPKASS